MFDQMKLAENIKTFRAGQGMSQTQLAAALGISPQSVSKWESGSSAPDLTNLCLLAQVLGVSVDMLLNSVSAGKVLIGIDGGGSKTEFVMFTPEGDLLDRLVLGSCNPNAVGLEECVQLLSSGINALSSVHGDAWGIYIGGSGFLTGGNGKKIRSMLQRIYPSAKILCETDIMNVIASATDAENCVAVICGTGAIVYAKEGERLTRLGGWGYLLSESGSGYDIGRDVLRAALADSEGMGEKTAITALVQKKLDAPVSDCIRQVYLHDQSYIASFAPLAFEAYAAGDGIAAEILKGNARGLARMINFAARNYSCGSKVVLSGGLITGNAVFSAMVKEELDASLVIEIPQVPQVIGACRRCAKMCGIEWEKADRRLLAQYKERG